MKDLVSVIVPIYNIESYITTCLDSIIKQTYNNIEIIVVLRKTEDNSLKICEYYKKIDKRIKLLVIEENSNKNLKNIGLETAKGAYITFIDGGDTVLPHYIEYMAKLAFDEKADIVCTKYYVKGTKPKKTKYYSVYEKYDIMENYMHMSFKSNFFAKLYKADLFDDISYPNVTYYDDFMTSYKLFGKAFKLVNSASENYCLILNKEYFRDRITDYDRMKKIGSCFDMLSFIEENYPKLQSYCKTKICFEAIDLFRDVKDKDYRKQLYSYIKLYRKYAASDDRIDMSNKMLCARSLLGYHVMAFSFMIEKLLASKVE